MKDALATLKESSASKADYLYDLPWYVIIGPPGAGKTTALVNSGLRFPLSGGAKPAAIAGTGGTRYCDWWFTEDAVLIDTAGRYTTHDSDGASDRQSWLAFLDLLKKNRPRQPINGVLVAVSLQDMLTLNEEEVAAHAKAIRTRLLELHDRLKVEFPVYALFTKSDMVSGFIEYFGNLGENERKQVWGATFQTADKTKNLVSQTPEEFDTLIERLNQEMPDRLQEEPAPATRAALYGFPAQMSALKRPLYDFLNAIFEPTRYHARANLRGFYFTPGTQQGTPIDQLIKALVKNFGAEDTGAGIYSGVGKSFFLHDLIQKVIIGEAAWVSTDPSAVRRTFFAKAGAYALILLFVLAGAGALLTSYSRNGGLIVSDNDATASYSSEKEAGPIAKENEIADRDFNRILPLLQKLRYSPTGFENRDQSVPIAATFGLSQWDRLQTASQDEYRIALERQLRPRLLFRLEELLDEHRNDPSFVYDALKVYMMLGEKAPYEDRDLILSWERQDWAERLYPGAALAAGRQQLEDHLIAMLDMEEGREPLVDLSAKVVSDSQQLLARLSVKERAYDLLKSQARAMKDLRDWSAETAGGLDFDTVFQSADGSPASTITVPGFFTYAGFQRAFLDKLDGIEDRMQKEKWVLGGLADDGSVVAEQYKTLKPDLLDLYTREFVATWNGALKKIQLKPLTNQKPRYPVLTALSGANSPLKSLFESISNETSLTKERPDAKKDPAAATASAAPNSAAAATLGGGLSMPLGDAPGLNVEQAFRPYDLWIQTNGAHRQIDDLISQLSQIRYDLINSTVPSQTQQATTDLEAQIQQYAANANQLPDPFKDMMTRAGGDFSGDVTSSEHAMLSGQLKNQVSGVCQQLVNGRYPFNRGASSDIALQDFGQLFRPNGVFDSFFQTVLKKYVDTSNQNNWQWRKDQAVTRVLSTDTLRDFQRADQIKNTFFASGGTLPSIDMYVFPPADNTTGTTQRFEINGQAIVTQAPAAGAPPTPAAPQTLHWPGVAAGGRSSVSFSVDQPPGQAPSTLETNGAWSLFRLLDRGAARMSGDRLVANFVVGGHALQYQFAMGTTQNPYTLPALRDFKCPPGI
jgi:type VI secretion system protein ImpL